MKKHRLPKYVRAKKAKGHTYYYFDTGRKDETGKLILTRLPDVADTAFGRALAAAVAFRNKQERHDQPFMTVSKLIDLYEKSTTFRKRAANTQTTYHHYLHQIREEIGNAPVEEVMHADIQVLMDKRGATPAAANMIVRVVGALYTWGRKQRHTNGRPTENIEFNEIGEHMPWPEWLVEEALSSDDELISLSTALLYFTAQRMGDMLKMRWSDIRNGRIRVVQEKTQADLDIAIHARLAAVLSKAPRRGFTILAKPDGQPYKHDPVRRALKAFAKERGLEIVPHGLRKNAVNALLEAGCSVAETQAISGQSLGMVDHYAKHRNKARLGDAAILKWEGRTRG